MPKYIYTTQTLSQYMKDKERSKSLFLFDKNGKQVDFGITRLYVEKCIEKYGHMEIVSIKVEHHQYCIKLDMVA